MDSIYWLLLFIILLVIEVLTMGLTTIWFAGGSLAVFIIVSVVLLLFTRPWAMRYLNRRTIRTNAESMVGAVVRVTEAVDNIMGRGAAQAEGKIWTARAAQDDVTFAEGELAVVKEIRGVKLILLKKKEE